MTSGSTTYSEYAGLRNPNLTYETSLVSSSHKMIRGEKWRAVVVGETSFFLEGIKVEHMSSSSVGSDIQRHRRIMAKCTSISQQLPATGSV